MFDSDVLSLEISSDFSWDEHRDGRGLTGTHFAHQITAEEPETYWIFDHQEKTGGTEFNFLCNTRLATYDHLFIPWPGNWLGTTLGRTMRAKVIHGHGARFAREMMPWRTARMAIMLRDPKSLLVSWFQMQGRFMEERTGMPAPPLEEWIAFTARQTEGRGCNRQTEWLSATLQPRLAFPHFTMAPQPEDPQDQLELALERLGEYDLVAATESVGALFDLICLDSGITPAPAGPPRSRPENASPISSRKLIEALPSDSLATLCELTEKDQILYEAAAHMPNWFAPE